MNVRTAVAQRPKRGETVCGDAARVFVNTQVTIAVADGLGHGPQAAVASQAFLDCVEAHCSTPLPDLMKQASAALSTTRGAAAALVRIDSTNARIAFVGIGNIEMRLFGPGVPRSPAVCMPGIVGRQLKRINQFDVSLANGTRVVIFTDGISTRLDLKAYCKLPLQDMADAILADGGKDHDDATCVVIECFTDDE